MLHLEQLETRCLLSIVVTDPPESGGLHTLDFDSQPIGSDVQKNVEIFNNGPATTIDFSLTDFNLDSNDYTLSDTSLAFGASETKSITITFSPDAAVNYDEILTIQNANDIGDFVKVNANGSGSLADLVSIIVTDPPESGGLHTLDFDLQPIGFDVQKSVEIFNDGPATQIDFSLTDFNLDISDYTLSDTSLAFGAGETKSITITFSPDAAVNYDEVLAIQNANDIGDFVKVNVSGIGQPSDLATQNLSLTTLVVPGFAWSGESLGVSVDMTNAGSSDINANIELGFYVSSDVLFDAGDTLLFTQTQTNLAIGATVAIDESLDLSGLDGDYYVLAVADPNNLIVETNNTNNVAASELITFSPSSVIITDSIDPSDDREMDFGSTPVGNVIGPEFVTLTNISNNTTQIDRPTITGNAFSHVETGVFQTPPQYNSLEAIEITTDVPYLGQWEPETSLFNPGTSWLNLNLEEGVRIDIFSDDTSFSNNMNVSRINVYDPYGNRIASGQENQNGPEYVDSFSPLISGTYYLEIVGNSRGNDNNWGFYEILVSSGTLSGTDAPQLTLPDTGQLLQFSDELIPKDKLGNTQTTHHTDWIRASSAEGSSIWGSTFEITVTANNPLDIEIYDNQGRPILTESYFPGDPLISLEYYGEDFFTIVTQSQFNFSSTQLDLSIENVGSALNLETGQSGRIPVWFSPQESGLADETMTIISGQNFSNEIRLLGNGLPGDLVAAALTLENSLFPNLIPTGQALQVALRVDNPGPGDILDSSIIQYYLSSDPVLDNSDQLLTIVGAANSSTLGSVNDGTGITITNSIEIPSVPGGDYYILAEVDSTNLVTEVDEANNVVASELLTLSDADFILFDSRGEPTDGMLDFDAQSVGRTSSIEFVGIFNRSENPLTITDWTLGNGSDFQTVAGNDPGNAADDLVIQPGQTERIFMFFSPNSFQNADANNYLTDQLQLNLSSGDAAQYAVRGRIIGPDLIVKENAGAINDDFVEFGNISIGNSREETITLQNIGDGILTIESLALSLAENSPFIIPSFLSEIILPPQPEEGSSDPDLSSIEVTIGVRTDLVTGDFSDTLIIQSSENVNDGVFVLDLSARVIAPQLIVEENAQTPNDDSIGFDRLPVGQSSTVEIVRLLNNGSDTLVINDLRFSDNSEGVFAIETTNLPLMIDPGQSFELDVQFLTPEAAGPYTDTLVIDHGEGQTYLVRLDGVAAVPGFQIVLEDGTAFNETELLLPDTPLTQSTSQFFSIRNDSQVDVRIDAITTEGMGYSIVGPPGGNSFVLVRGETSPDLELRFDAQIDLGEDLFNGKLFIEGSQSREISLVTTTVTPQLEFPSDQDIDGLNFGSVEVGQQVSQSLEIQNNGTSPLTITNWLFSNLQFQTPGIDGELSIAPSDTVLVDVLYVPDQVNQFTGSEVTLTLESNDLDNQDRFITINLTAQSLGRPFPLMANSTTGFFDSNKNLVRITIINGSGIVYLDNLQPGGDDINTLRIIPDGDLAASVKISTRGSTTIGSILSDGSLKSILGSKVTLNRSIDIDGSLTQLVLNNINAGAEIQTSQPSFRAMTIEANKIGDDVNFDLAGEVKTFQAESFGSGGQLTALSFKKVVITRGELGADIFASSPTNGSIDKILVRQNISGTIVATQDIKKVMSQKGTISATIRAEQIGSIRALNLNQAIISAAELIGDVRIVNDILDSHVLSGYDIGLDGSFGGGDDTLSGGDINKFRFGGRFANTHVAVGVVPIFSDLLPAFSGPNSSGQGSIGSTSGDLIEGDNGGKLFGFYYAEDIKINLREQDDFVIVKLLG